MKNKVIFICDYIIFDDIDVIVFMEMWFGIDVDNVVL